MKAIGSDTISAASGRHDIQVGKLRGESGKLNYVRKHESKINVATFSQGDARKST
jgi:hypothetical protein